MLGLKKVVIKSHGSSKPQTMSASIANAAQIYRNGLVPQIEKMLGEVDLDSLIPAEDVQ